MSRAFEERVGQHLDALFQDALFLTGGEVRVAAALLLGAVTLGPIEQSGNADGASFWRRMEARLVRVFLEQERLEGLPEPDCAADGGAEAVDLGEVDPRALFRAAGVIPAWPRAALWLVILRRWSYEDAATTMGIHGDEQQRSPRGFLGFGS